MSHQLTFPGMCNAISSPESAGGLLPCALPDGPMTERYGPDRAHASLSARQAKEMGLMTSGTCGRHSHGSSASANLQSLLESKLQARLQSLGSTLYSLTWKAWVTPAGRSLPRLRASAARTSVTGPTGRVTPTTRDWKDSGADLKPRQDTGKERFDQLPRQANLCGWPTPMAGDGLKGGKGQNPAYLTPTAWQAVGGPARLTVHGVTLTGSPAGMESGGQLNPEHSRWLMGYPHVWDACAVTAMPSSRKQPRSS